jgi:hypothetical protein
MVLGPRQYRFSNHMQEIAKERCILFQKETGFTEWGLHRIINEKQQDCLCALFSGEIDLMIRVSVNLFSTGVDGSECMLLFSPNHEYVPEMVEAR